MVRRKICIFCGQTVAGQRVEIKTSSKMHQRGMFRCHARKIAVKDVVADKKSKLKLNECKLYHVNQIVRIFFIMNLINKILDIKFL